MGTRSGDLNLDDHKRRNGRYFALIFRIRQLWGPTPITSMWLK